MGLRELGETLPPGFRFNPSDSELICYYLYKKISNEDAHKGTLVDVDLHTCEPWQLPDVAKLNANEWYFFSFRDRKYATGYRTNRATISGYWKATGKDRTVMDSTTSEVVGMRKTLVFYKNRAPNGTKTRWIMHEFRLESAHMAPKEDWVLCRVFHKSKGSESTNQITNMETDYSSPQYLATNNNYSAPNSSKTNMSSSAGYHQISSLIPSSLHLRSPILDERLSLSMSKWNSMFELRHQEWKDTTESASHVTEMVATSSSKHQDDDTGAADYGFLYEMGLDDNRSLVTDEMHRPSSTDVCMLFEADDSIVFH